MIRIYLVFRYEIKTLSVIELSDDTTKNVINDKTKTGELRIKRSLGENNGSPAIKRRVIITVTILIMVKAVLIRSLLFFSVGRNLTRALLYPNKLKLTIRAETDKRVVANPICSGEKSLVFIIQKKNPKKAMTPVLNIRYIELL